MSLELIVLLGTLVPFMCGVIFVSGRTYQKVNGSHKVMKSVEICLIDHGERISNLEGYERGKRAAGRKLDNSS